MKIKVELTSTEVNKARKVSTNIAKALSKALNRDFTEENEKEFKKDFDTVLTTKSSNMNTGDINCHASEDGKGTVIDINLKTSFVTSVLNIADIFYVGVADFMLKIRDPFKNFIEKFM
jgi:hypothetical protein